MHIYYTVLHFCFVYSDLKRRVSVLLRGGPMQTPETFSCFGSGNQGKSQNCKLFSCSTTESKDNL